MWLKYCLNASVCTSTKGKAGVWFYPPQSRKNVILLTALSLAGIGESLIVDGAVNAELFEKYIEHILLPSLQPGQIVVMDNARIHKGKRVQQLIEERGCQVLFLPAYSPDFSPIEEAFSKIKTFLHQRGFKGDPEPAMHSKVPWKMRFLLFLLLTPMDGSSIVATPLLLMRFKGLKLLVDRCRALPRNFRSGKGASVNTFLFRERKVALGLSLEK
jgi:transposase